MQAAADGSQISNRRPLMLPPVSAATRGPTPSITSRVPNGTTRGSTETISRELDLPKAVTPLPVWQLTSKLPSRAPRAAAVLVGANDGTGRVVAGEARGGVALLQATRSTPPATAPSSAAVGGGRRRRCPAQTGTASSYRGHTRPRSGHERVNVARQPLPERLQLHHLPVQRAQHRPHLRPGHLRLGRHTLGDPADELIGVKRLAGRRASM